jgi:hypothetical protein
MRVKSHPHRLIKRDCAAETSIISALEGIELGYQQLLRRSLLTAGKFRRRV